MKKSYRQCSVCGKRRDEITNLCPTPEACEKLRSPLKRLRSEQAASERRLREAATAHADVGIGVTASALVVPGDEQRHEDAVRRAVTGWKRSRRSREQRDSRGAA